MPRVTPAPWPVGTSVALHGPRGIAGNGEPSGTPLATAPVVAGVGPSGLPANEVVWTGVTASGPAIATAIVAGKRVSVRLHLG